MSLYEYKINARRQPPHCEKEGCHLCFLGRMKITLRETEVLALICMGMRTKQIASRMGISNQTAKIHVFRVQHKIGAESRLQVALWAIHKGVWG